MSDQPTPNYDNWQLLLRDVCSPQSYIDFGFWFVISAALQRRVWMGGPNPNDAGQLFTNIYPILVGDPGVGKGRVISPVNSILRHWRQELTTGKILDPSEEELSYENFLFPCGPENVTFEALIDRMAKSYRRASWEHCISPLKVSGSLEGKPDMLPKIYGHSSMYFSLEELSSLIQKDTNKITDFLIQTYDCGDFRRETKTHGIVPVKKPCLTFLAGTTPNFMEETFKDKLLTDGMSSRCWFIFEFANRMNTWGIKPLDNEQLRARLELLLWLKKLALLYGRVELSVDADDFLKNWWINQHPIYKPNNNLKLASYYKRKDIHVLKLAMLMHFSETIDTFIIPIETAVRALKALDEIEVRMHYALNFGSRNPLSASSRKILSYMSQMRRPVTKMQLLDEFNTDLRDSELVEVLKFMVDTDKIVWKEGMYYAKGGVNSAFLLDPALVVNHKIRAEDLKALPLDKPIEEGERKEIDL